MPNPHPGWRVLVADLLFFGAAFAVVNIIAYLYIVIAGRTLAGEEFGVFNALFGLIAIAGFLGSSVQLAVTQAAALNPGRSALTALMRATFRIGFPIIALLTCAGLPAASAIGADPQQVALAGVVVLAMFPGFTAMGFLVGVGRIRAQAGVNLLGALARIATGWPLMIAGAGVMGAILGYLFTYLVILVLAWHMSWQLVKDRPPEAATLAPPVRLEASAVATFVLAFAPFALDQLLVQVFAPALGGDYAAIATMAKVVFFAAYPIIAVVYPHLLRRLDDTGRARLVGLAAAGVLSTAVGLAWVLATFPGESTEIFFGNRYGDAAAHVGSLAFGVACFSMTVLGAHALIAFESRMGFLPSLVALAASVLLFAVRHDSLATVVSNQVWVYELQLLLMLALLGPRMARVLKRKR